MKTFLTLLIFVSTVVTAQTNTAWKKITQSNYSVEYPSNWELDQTGKMGAIFFMFAPLESADDKFRENVNLMIQDLTGRNIDLDKYTEISLDQIKTQAVNGKLIESKKLKDGSGEYQKLIYTSDQNGFHLKYEQLYYVKDNKAYLLTLTSEQNKFDEFKADGEKILNSFKLKK